MPAALSAEIGKLLQSSRYDVAILPQLEAYIDEQCSSQGYDLEANLATLKLYQFHPDQLKAPVVAKILIKALMSLPKTDFLSCTYLIPERVLDEAPISTICSVANLLETCSFREFWSALEPLRAGPLAATPGFDAAVRAFILTTFEITFQSVPTGHVKGSLGMTDDSALGKLITERGWTVTGDLVKVSLNPHNQPRPKQLASAEAMTFPQMTKILAAVASSSS